MKVFVTGATGFIGSVTVKELIDHGHSVVGLARNEESAEKVRQLGATPLKGDLENIESLKAGVKDADVVIHLAFIHDFANFAKSLQVDKAALVALGEALSGTGKTLVVASGSLGLQPGKVNTEDDVPPEGPMSARHMNFKHVEEMAKKNNFKAICVRFSPSVHGAGDKGFVPAIIDAARKNGFVVQVGDGQNCWNAVHRNDLAKLLRLIIEKPLEQTVLHGIAEEAIPLAEIIKLISEKLGVPVKQVTAEEARQHYGFVGMVVGLDGRASSHKTQELVGWRPTEVGLLEDMKANYF